MSFKVSSLMALQNGATFFTFFKNAHFLPSVKNIFFKYLLIKEWNCVILNLFQVYQEQVGGYFTE